ncbi:MAG: HutD/Ves family protein [Steroidobacteraceae bacterium]
MSRHAKKKPGFQVRKYATYHSMPWRNGRGFTREIAREPAVGDDFAWRLSLADIERDGDFSPYPGYRRALVLVAGNRLQLRFRGRGNCLLDPRKRGARFEGDWATRCAVPEGRCTDLSLIVRRGQATRPAAIVRAPRVVRVKSTERLVLAGDLYSALFILEGSVAVTESKRARARTARAQDTVLLAPGPQRTLRLRRLGHSAMQLVLLRWRPGRPAALKDSSGLPPA